MNSRPPGMARQLRAGVRTAVSPNDRLQQLWHPWTSYVIVPLFGLANAGIPIDVGFLAKAYTSPITLGIIIGYVVGKPTGVMAVSGLVNRVTGGRLRPPVGWGAALGGGTLAGMGFTVSLLVASVAFTGIELKKPPSVCSLPWWWPACSRGWYSKSPDDCPRLFAPGRCSAGPRHRRPRRSRRGRPRPHPRAGGRPRDPCRVWRLRMPILRAGRTCRSGTAERLR